MAIKDHGFWDVYTPKPYPKGAPAGMAFCRRDGDGVDMCAADCPILAAAASGHEEVRDASVLNKEGLARWIRYAHAPIVAADGDMDADVVVVRDVTRERQTDELKADFVASVSHELRTPLTPIKGFLMTLLREDRDFAQDRRREYYKLMLMQSQRLERLIEDLLEVTRLEAGAGLVDATAIDAVDLVRQVVDRFTSEDPDRTVHVVAPTTPSTAAATGCGSTRCWATCSPTPCATPRRTSRSRSASSPRAARWCSRSATGGPASRSTSSRASSSASTGSATT